MRLVECPERTPLPHTRSYVVLHRFRPCVWKDLCCADTPVSLLYRGRPLTGGACPGCGVMRQPGDDWADEVEWDEEEWGDEWDEFDDDEDDW